MPGRDLPRVSDPDDWFGDLSGDAPPGAETWSAQDEGPPAAERRLDGGSGTEGADAGLTVKLGTLLALVAAVVVLVVVAGLALGGVFSGSDKRPPTSATTAPGGTTTRTASTSPTTRTRPARPVSPAPSTTLKPGDQGAQVRLLQRALTRLGYDAGTIDGDYGSATEAALTGFQKASHLAADGVLGPASLRSLKLALTKRTR